MKYNRVVLMVLDSVGVGALPDAQAFGDALHNNTVGNIEKTVGLSVPHLESLGLSAIVHGISPHTPFGVYGKCAEVSAGKDSTTGHWEIAGLQIAEAFPTYPNGFPQEIIDQFTRETGYGVLCNKPYSGSEVIADFGDEHCKSGNVIVYTSADSVFQIAAHEAVIRVDDLYIMCKKARAFLQGDHGVARVIARPFIGTTGAYTRTPRRKDFSFDPPGDTLLDVLHASGVSVTAIGKIGDLFAHRGMSRYEPTTDNADGIEKTLQVMNEQATGLIFTNLVDFDVHYGHRRDPAGYRDALESFDARVPDILDALGPQDLLLITADHGNDPTFAAHTDHTREYVPVLAYSPGIISHDLGVRETFSDIGQTVAEIFGCSVTYGTSFLSYLRK